MAVKQPPLTRRVLLSMIALMPAALAAPARATAARAATSESLLRAALAGLALPHAGARLDLVTFDQHRAKGRVRLSAVVRMTWAPGMRQRPFSVMATDPEAAQAALLREVQARFSDI